MTKMLSALACLLITFGCSRPEASAPAAPGAPASASTAASPAPSGGPPQPLLLTDLRAAASKLSDAHSFHFDYSQEMKNYNGGKRFKNVYIGDANLEKNLYHYTMTSEKPDDQKYTGEWIVSTSNGGYTMTGFHKEGAGWVKYTNGNIQKSPDIAFLGMDSFRRVLANACLVVSDDQPDKNPKFVESTTLDGKAVDHYKATATQLLPGTYDIYVDKASQTIVRASCVSDGSDYSLTPTRVGEAVTISEPAS